MCSAVFQPAVTLTFDPTSLKKKPADLVKFGSSLKHDKNNQAYMNTILNIPPLEEGWREDTCII